ncbi:MAG TPA: ATP-binding protein [Caulobacteraceae bacterium]|nr:ATP-binding protein [Caulobacteraceae bacterium]
MANPASPIGGSKGERETTLPAALAVGLLLLAAMLAAGPALSGGPDRGLALGLLGALAVAAAIALPALRRQTTAADPTTSPEALVRALAESSAIVAEDGSIEAANDGWREEIGAHRRLQRTPIAVAQGLLRVAVRERLAAQTLTLAGVSRRVEAARLDGGRFLLRLMAATGPTVVEAPPAQTAPSAGPARLDAFAAASPFGAALIEGDDLFGGEILEVNSAWASIAGEGAALGATLGPAISEESRASAAAKLAAGGVGPFEVTPAANPDRFAHLYVTHLADRSVAYLVDVTEQKQLQAQLVQANKMQAIGQLAGGVAHDFNNLLTAILLNISELEMRHPLGDPTHDGLNRIRGIALRAANLVGQLLTFSRKVTVQREALDLGEMVNSVAYMLSRLLPETVRLDIDYGRNLPHVHVDRQQLENAVMNLVVNARDALREQGGGSIKVRTARVSAAEAAALGHEGAPTGEFALIEVADDGPGISPDALSKIFDPFFTTKAVGEGTGLGLATVYGVVKQSDGYIAVSSRPGEGATFRIFLPVYDPPTLVEPPAPAQPKGRTAARDLSGVGRILFVEDEDEVRRIAAQLLRRRGYEVIEAADGEEALLLAEENAGQLHLMISDVIMPGLDGPKLLKAARPFIGDIPVMFISGYAEAEFSKVLEGESGVSFLPKPLDIPALAERVKQLLQAA